MKLKTKKELAVRALKVGKSRISFVKERLEEIKEAITKQDIKDLKNDGAIKVKEVSGRKKNAKKTRRSTGNIRKKINTRKRDYVIMTRKLRRYAKEMHLQGKIGKEDLVEIRKKIRNRKFNSKANLKLYIQELK
jgi:large subunit ribosomal protein L19e